MPEFDQQALMGDDDAFCADGATTEATVILVMPERLTLQTQFGDDADNAILKAAALDLLSTVRKGVPQGAIRSVKFFAQSWNSASADTQLPTDGKYTQTIQAALDAALTSLAPGSGAVPQAIL